MLKKKDSAAALTLIEKACRTFDDDTTSGALINETRKELLEQLG